VKIGFVARLSWFFSGSKLRQKKRCVSVKLKFWVAGWLILVRWGVLGHREGFFVEKKSTKKQSAERLHEK